MSTPPLAPTVPLPEPAGPLQRNVRAAWIKLCLELHRRGCLTDQDLKAPAPDSPGLHTLCLVVEWGNAHADLQVGRKK